MDSTLIRQMGHLTLEVPDPISSAADLVEIVGVKITSQTDREVMLSSNRRRYDIALRRAAAPRVLAIGLEAESLAAVDEIRRRVIADGLPILDDRSLHADIEAAIRFRGPCGSIFEVHTPIPRTATDLHIGLGSRPRRFEHVNILVLDPRATGDFLRQTLGLRLSDTAGDHLLAWYRAGDGLHHTVAVGPGPGKLHHYAFDLHCLEDLAGIADRLAMKGRSLIWGPGRHGAGRNVFTYYVDPDGCIVENSIEMMRVDVEATYTPTHWPIGEGMSGRWINLWGAGPPPNFMEPGLSFA